MINLFKRSLKPKRTKIYQPQKFAPNFEEIKQDILSLTEIETSEEEAAVQL